MSSPNRSPEINWRLVTCLICTLPIISSVSFIFSSPFFIFDHINLSNKPQIEEECDLFKGHWVEDPNGSLYNSTNCRWIPERKNCFKHGRRDTGFVNWRWKPEGCELPRFDPKAFLRIVRGKRMVFIGDSVARNQMDSLLCLLSQEVVPIEIYNNGEDNERTMSFPSHNFTLQIISSLFLVKGAETIQNGPKSFDTSYNLHLDKVDPRWAKQLPGMDYVILSDGHWFFRKHYLYKNDTLIGCTKCGDQTDLPDLGLGYAFREAFETSLNYINEKSNVSLTVVRTYSPSHFENGNWFTGGYCNRTGPLSEEEVKVEGLDWELRTIQAKEIQRLRSQERVGSKKRFRILDLTKAMLARADGHPDFHGENREGKAVHDCLHWCLPGPIDAWNDLLLAVVQREDDSFQSQSNRRAKLEEI